MSEEIKDGGPAFPSESLYEGIHPNEKLISNASQGMSLRDWFAGLAMVSMIRSANPGPEGLIDKISEVSFKISDSMLEARKK